MSKTDHMYVMHGTCYIDEHSVKFLLWSETSDKIKKTENFHPFATSAQKTVKLLNDIINDKKIKTETTSLPAHFPTFGNTPLLSNQISGMVDYTKDSEIDNPELKEWAVPCAVVDIADIFTILSGNDKGNEYIIPGSDFLFWRNASQFVYNIIAERKFLPTVVEDSFSVRSRWTPILETSSDQSMVQSLVKDMPLACLAFNYGQIDAETLLKTYMNVAVDTFCRSQINTYTIPAQGGDALKWVSSLSSGSSLVTFSRSLAIQKISSWSRAIQSRIDFPLQMAFDLIPPDGDDDTWKLRFMVQSKNDPSLIIPFERIWGRNDVDAMAFIKKYTEFPEEFLLQSLGMAQLIFPPIKKALQSANPAELPLTSDEVYQFLKDYGAVLGESGFSVLFPEWWGKKSGKPALKIKASPGSQTKKLGLETLVKYDLEIVMDGEPIGVGELERLAAIKSRFVHIGKKWLEIDKEQLNKILKMLRDNKKQVPLAQLLSMAGMDSNIPVIDIEGDGWLKNLFNKEHHMDMPEQPAGLMGELREYQKQGLSWLNFMAGYGFGCCLADDMGLGKTIEIISYMLKRHESQENKGVTLVVCPTSVISNWVHELNKFAPSLRVHVHHGSDRMKEQELVDTIINYDVVITSYSLLTRDFNILYKINWEGIVADEAQYIKNSGTKQSRAIRSLSAMYRIALTGTPIENRLEDLRSIFDFINPGYLGGEKTFKKNFTEPIIKEGDDTVSDKLGRLVGPFILRRVKTDKNVISDLPEKEEIKLYVPVSREQATLYAATVKAMLEDVEELKGIKRSGIILSTITKLKRLMDHPSLVSGDKNYNEERSEKMVRLMDMLEEILANGEKVLIFTQYIEAGKIIKELIIKRFHEEALFLSGNVPRIVREQMIERFQNAGGPKIFIISVKAGGAGINLTAATNVIHFDRWWNPAVENQATDRAYRIGQSKLVRVYKFISTGTIEEKIDGIIEGKTYLSKKIIKSTDESWVSNLSTSNLKDLFTLRKEAIAEVKD